MILNKMVQANGQLEDAQVQICPQTELEGLECQTIKEEDKNETTDEHISLNVHPQRQ